MELTLPSPPVAPIYRTCRQAPLTNRRRLVVYLGSEDSTDLEELRQRASKVTGKRPSLGLIMSAAISALMKSAAWR